MTTRGSSPPKSSSEVSSGSRRLVVVSGEGDPVAERRTVYGSCTDKSRREDNKSHVEIKNRKGVFDLPGL